MGQFLGRDQVPGAVLHLVCVWGSIRGGLFSGNSHPERKTKTKITQRVGRDHFLQNRSRWSFVGRKPTKRQGIVPGSGGCGQRPIGAQEYELGLGGWMKYGHLVINSRWRGQQTKLLRGEKKCWGVIMGKGRHGYPLWLSEIRGSWKFVVNDKGEWALWATLRIWGLFSKMRKP